LEYFRHQQLLFRHRLRYLGEADFLAAASVNVVTGAQAVSGVAAVAGVTALLISFFFSILLMRE